MTDPRRVEERRTTPEQRTFKQPRGRRSAGALGILLLALGVLVVAYAIWVVAT